MTDIDVLSLVDALRLIGGGLDVPTFGPDGVRPMLAIALGADVDPSLVARLSSSMRGAPIVLVGIAAGSPPAGVEATFDVLLAAGGRDRPGARPWTIVDDPAAALRRLAGEVEAAPRAAVALVQLLRATEAVDVVDAVVCESFVYSLLQGDDRHRRWLADRVDTARHAPPTGPIVTVDRRGETLLVTLDRPEVRNAYGARMRDELVDALQVGLAAPEVAVELRGAGPTFCSGGDLDEFGTAADPVSAHLVRTTRNAGLVLARLTDRVTAYVHGSCVGAGVELPAFTGRVVAHPDTTFRLPEIGMGLVPGAGGTASIPRRVGRHRAAWLALSGEPIPAGTALAWGLADEIDASPFT